MNRLGLVTAFGIIGVLSRYGLGLLVPRFLPPPFPYATLLINLGGAFAIGVVFVLGTERMALNPNLSVGIMVGLLGGFTTFSSYCLDTLRLIGDGDYKQAAFYFVGSPILGLLATLGGVTLTRLLTS